ncbi:MAG: RagB/SusD family nutrient uptake outer membrane protein [Dysgonamonadaceae bacterium]|nr:RagB/SusD family nutrient uptake outer membrane protein [Dysgonamonadaceae bacterium]
MKKNKIYLILGILLSMSSCLDLNPLDQMADGNMWKSASDFKYFANNFYGWPRDFTHIYNDGPHSDLRSDLMIPLTSTNVFSHGNNTIQETDNNYTDNYNRIRRTNLLLKNAAGYSGGEAIDQYVGEAHFFRAYCHFELVQLFGNVIIVKEVMDINSPELQKTRDPRTEVVDFIIQDLRDAASKMAETAPENGRLSKYAALSFLSRVALYEGTWQKFRGDETKGKEYLGIAATAAREVIDSRSYELFKPAALGEYAYRYLFTLEDEQSTPVPGINKASNKEYIYYRRHDNDLNRPNINITHGAVGNAFLINRKFVNLYLCNDGLPIEKSTTFQGYATMVSEFQNRDNRMKNCFLQQGEKFWTNDANTSRIDWKGMDGEDAKNALTCNAAGGSGYQNKKWGTERSVIDYYEGYDFPIIRYAEVLLNYAEAVYERDNAISNDDLDLSLNPVRNRVNVEMPKLSNELVSANGLDMRTEIRRERTVELYFEGFRIDDLKRWKTAETEMLQDILGIKWAGTQFETAWGTQSTRAKDADGCLIMENGRSWGDKNYLLPLPADQLQLNPNLEQNPLWNQ